MPRGRFAPSPTGELHLGSARTALCAYLAARRDGGSFVLRIEDLDPPRVIPGAAERILEDLRWLGLEWDEGPDVGGPCGPYVQSERTERYEAALARLAADGHLFPCWCSRTEVLRASAAPHGATDEGPRYPGTCRELGEAERAARAQRGRQSALRLRVPKTPIALDDAVFGAIAQDVAQAVGDFVLRRADGLYAYQLAVVVDDLEMGIGEIVRGDDLLDSTPRQLLLRRLLGGSPTSEPQLAHVPLVLGPDGTRLSKRHGAIGVRALRAAGHGREQVVGWLGATLGLCPWGTRATPQELLPGFHFARLPRAPTVWAGPQELGR